MNEFLWTYIEEFIWTRESWHSQLSKDEKSHITINKLIEKLRKEQSNSENLIIQIKSGIEVQVKRKAAQIERDARLFKLVKIYNKDFK